MKIRLHMVLGLVLMCGVSNAADMTLKGNIFTTGGIQSQGNVGINNSAAMATLDVKCRSYVAGGGFRLSKVAPSSDYWDARIENNYSALIWRCLSKDYVFSLNNSGYVGIGVSNPSSALDLNGMLCIREILNAPALTTTATGAYLLAGDFTSNSGMTHGTGPGLYAQYKTTRTRLSSHIDPREIDPNAVTSFSDQSVELPFSFAHADALIGKGQIVDMAKMVSYIEKKMKAEVGENAGKLVYTFDLPSSDTISLEKYQLAQSVEQAKEIMDKLERMPWIKIQVGTDGQVPADAFIEVPVYETMMQKKKITKKMLDLTSKRIVVVESEELTPIQVDTGRKQNQLRANYRFENGELYRKPTVSDVNIDSLLANNPKIPVWIIGRIKAGQQVSMDIKTLTEEILKTIASKADAATQQATAQEIN